MPDDLWPENIAESNLVTPVTILKEQAARLGEKTQQLVTGEVVTTGFGTMFVHTFNILAPTLAYKYELFRVTHGVAFYPLTVKFVDDISIQSEDEFKQKLKDIFASQRTLNIVHSILAQVRS